MFTNLLSKTDDTPEGEKTLQNAVGRKRRILYATVFPDIRKTLGILEGASLTRPSLNLLDINDEGSITRFMAREQLDCEFNCPPYGTKERINELMRIISGQLQEGESIWITEYETDKKLSAYDMLGYFEVWIRDTPQDSSERQKNITKFRAFYHQIPHDTQVN